MGERVEPEHLDRIALKIYLHTMKILQYLEKAWIIAAVCALALAIYNLIRIGTLADNHVYFPFFCAMFCLLIWFNVRGQRKFKEKIFDKEEEGEN